MAKQVENPFGRADVFHLFDGENTLSSSSNANGISSPLSEAQYTALVAMMATQLHLSSDEAERLFPAYHEKDSLDIDPKLADGNSAAVAASSVSPSVTPPPLCAHVSREGVDVYWRSRTADCIPSVRCCDAREIQSAPVFPDPGHGPHLHCLYCFQSSVESAPEPGTGIPPPVVADFRDAATLQAHHHEHQSRYHTYLQLLEGSNASGIGQDMLSDLGVTACEAAAEQESRHACYMASAGTAACAVVVFYCAACDSFAPLVRFRRCEAAVAGSSGEAEGNRTETAVWTSVEDGNMVLSRLLLSCHLLYMLDPARFTAPSSGSGPSRRGGSSSTSPAPLRHLIYLFRPLLFDVETEDDLIEEFERDAECTYAAAVLPHATVIAPDNGDGDGASALLLLAPEAASERKNDENAAVPYVAPHRFSPVVIGYAMEWATEALAQSKVDLALGANAPIDGASATATPFQVTQRWVYLADTEEWVRAWVLYHRTVNKNEYLPTTYADVSDEGIRVQDEYEIAAPMPVCGTLASAHVGASALDTSENEEAGTEEADDVPNALALDGCPYSMEARSMDFFVRMMALAKAMHELAVWRLSVDENKEPMP